ncbi:hypothetical protein V1511DRAFT_494823 [Dipodascopsis uninucleata]
MSTSLRMAKGGVLPKPRSILTIPRAPPKPGREGYAEGIVNKPGTQRVPTIKPYPDIKVLIDKTVHEPKDGRKSKEISNLRRQYYRESIMNAHKQIIKARTSSQAKNISQNEKMNQSTVSKMEEESQKLFTLPTVESYISEYHSQTSSKDRKEVENLLAEARRLRTLADRAEVREAEIIRIFNSTDMYIVSEDKLNESINTVFEDGRLTFEPDYKSRSLKSHLDNRQKLHYGIRARNGIYSKVFEDLMGVTSRGHPGVAEIADAFSYQDEMDKHYSSTENGNSEKNSQK